MFDHLIAENDLVEEFAKHGLFEQDLLFIKEQIAGPRLRKDKDVSITNQPVKRCHFTTNCKIV